MTATASVAFTGIIGTLPRHERPLRRIDGSAMRKLGAVLGLSCALSCASTSRSSYLEELYPVGADRSVGARQTQRHQSQLAFTRTLDAESGGSELGSDVRDGVGPRLSSAVGYDAYRVQVRRGQGYSARSIQYCDYVFFDASQKVVAAYRREGGC